MEGEQPSRSALVACARWLGYCLSIGWPAGTLDRLEAIWWEHHDHRGRLVSRQEVGYAE